MEERIVKQISFQSGLKDRKSDRWWERRWWLWWSDVRKMRFTIGLTERRRQLRQDSTSIRWCSRNFGWNRG